MPATLIDLTDLGDRCCHGPRPQNCLECLSAGSGPSAHLAAPYRRWQGHASASMVATGPTWRQFAYATSLARRAGFASARDAASERGLAVATRADWSALIGELVASVRVVAHAHAAQDRLAAAAYGT